MRIPPLQPRRRQILSISCMFSAIIFMIVPFIFINPIRFNVTTAINHPEYHLLTAVCLTIFTVSMFVLFLLQSDPLGRQKHYYLECAVVLGLVMATALVPYNEAREDFLSGLHVFLGYVTFLYINRILIPLVWYDGKRRGFYLAGTVLVYLLTLTFASVNGLAEILYAGLTAFTLYRNLNS